jgi:hypothetical protein
MRITISIDWKADKGTCVKIIPTMFMASQTQGGSKFVQEFSDRLLGESYFSKTNSDQCDL